MLFLVVLASLVTFTSTATLPVSNSDSPSANHGLSLVTPVKSSRLNARYAQTHEHLHRMVNTEVTVRYPPGYPGQAYNYPVPGSNLNLHCWHFADESETERRRSR